MLDILWLSELINNSSGIHTLDGVYDFPLYLLQYSDVTVCSLRCVTAPVFLETHQQNIWLNTTQTCPLVDSQQHERKKTGVRPVSKATSTSSGFLWDIWLHLNLTVLDNWSHTAGYQLALLTRYQSNYELCTWKKALMQHRQIRSGVFHIRRYLRKHR